MRKIKGWIDAGFCFVNGKQERFSRSKVPAYATISLEIPKQEKKELSFLFEDEAILVLNKPAGISCDERLVSQLAKCKKSALLVHRLDKETTGVLLCAKSNEIKDYFIEQFRNHLMQKHYVAIVDGVVQGECGTIENYLGPISRFEGHVKWGKVNKDGHFAETHWKVLKRAKKATMLELRPKTGRTHQLRVHTSQMGHPILGDFTYADTFRCPYKSARVLLHAERLAFTHPKTKRIVEYQAEIPADFAACLKELFSCVS